jgi:hypothetical protein
MVSLKFELAPFVGPIPLKFGMSREQVAELLGTPKRTLGPNDDGVFDEIRDPVFIRYHEKWHLWDASFAPGCVVLFNGRSLFDDADTVQYLQGLDPSNYESVGFLQFPKLGLMLSGFHDGDESQKAITISSRACLDFYEQQLKSL